MIKKKVLAIVLCRNNSTRLKQKLKLKIQNLSCFEFFFDRLTNCKNIDDIIIATTNNKNDEYFVRFAKKNKIKIFRGSESNVLKRMVDAYKSINQNFDIIVRGNSDNTLIMPNIIDEDVNDFLKTKSDFYSPFAENKIPFGYSLTLFKPTKLVQISKKKLSKKYKEHIDNYFLDNKKKFKILKKKQEKYYCPNLFLTLDTNFDYKRIKFYANKLKRISLNNQATELIKIYKKHR